MPIYEYVCTECGEKVEIWATISEKEKGLNPTCPKCGSKKMAQVFSSVMIGRGSNRGGFNPGSIPGCDSAGGPSCC